MSSQSIPPWLRDVIYECPQSFVRINAFENKRNSFKTVKYLEEDGHFDVDTVKT